MGNALSGDVEGRNVGRQQAVTEGRRRHRGLPPGSAKSTPDDWPFIEVCPSQPGRQLSWLQGRSRRGLRAMPLRRRPLAHSPPLPAPCPASLADAALRLGPPAPGNPRAARPAGMPDQSAAVRDDGEGRAAAHRARHVRAARGGGGDPDPGGRHRWVGGWVLGAAVEGAGRCWVLLPAADAGVDCCCAHSCCGCWVLLPAAAAAAAAAAGCWVLPPRAAATHPRPRSARRCHARPQAWAPQSCTWSRRASSRCCSAGAASTSGST